MAKNNNKSTGLLQNAKLRLVFIAAAIVIVFGGVVTIWHYKSKAASKQSSASVATAPSIQSVPGAGNPSTQYVKVQTQQNRQEELAAKKNMTSAVPTITRPSFIGSPNLFSSKKQSGPTCPINKVVVMFKPNPASCGVNNLRLARTAGVTAEELRCQACSCASLKAAGYTAGELKGTGYTAKSLHLCGFDLGQLVQAGYTPKELKAAGYSVKQLANVGFTPAQLRAAGYTPQQIKKAGYTEAQLKAANIDHTNCSVSALKKARLSGVSAAVLRNNGCGLPALKAAGFSARQLKNAGYSAQALKNAGFSDAALKAAGFTPAQIANADKNSKICSVAQLKKDRAKGVSAEQLKNKNCGLSGLKAAGYTAGELKAAGYTAKQLKDAGFTPKQLKQAGYSAKQLKHAGFSAAALKKAGYTAQQLKAAGFTPKQLKAAGYTAKQLKKAGFSAAALKAAGYNAGQLKAAGYTAKQLKDAGFNAKQLRNAGYSAAALKKAGFTPEELRHAGYTKGDLLRAGFTPKQAGYQTAPAKKTIIYRQAPNSQTANTTGGSSASMPSINSPEQRLAKLEKMQQKQMSAQQQADAVQRRQGAMTLEAQKFLSGWSNSAPQTMQKALKVTKTVSANAGSNAATNAALNGHVFKAGTIMFAVLITSINSDEKTPIMARIVSGKLKGSKLLGNFKRVDKKVYIRFHLLNDPKLPKSVAINAVAIDPNTARTAVSGHVNNHYLLRYGTLFASAFLEGLSDAIIHSNSTTQCGFFGCWTQRGNLNTSQQVAVGLGTVGRRYGQVMGHNFYTPPTIKIKGGTGIGILVMSDFNVPKLPSKEPAQNNNNHLTE